jgi:hypothetical protein
VNDKICRMANCQYFAMEAKRPRAYRDTELTGGNRQLEVFPSEQRSTRFHEGTREMRGHDKLGRWW